MSLPLTRATDIRAVRQRAKPIADGVSRRGAEARSDKPREESRLRRRQLLRGRQLTETSSEGALCGRHVSVSHHPVMRGGMSFLLMA